MSIPDTLIVILREIAVETEIETVTGAVIATGVVTTIEAGTEIEIPGDTGVPCLGGSRALPPEQR